MKVQISEKLYQQKEGQWMIGVGGFFLVTVAALLLVTAPHPSQSYLAAIEQHNVKLRTFFSQQAFLQAALKELEIVENITAFEIQERDRAWRVLQGEDALVQAILVTELSKQLQRFTVENSEYSEILVTGINGVVIGMTNVTSDYFQADELWWTTSFADGKGQSWVGEIEFDESAGVWGLPVYNPIFGAEGKLIGISKTLIDTQLLY